MRYFKAIYFPIIDEKGKKQVKNVAVAFNPEKEPYLTEKAKAMTSTKIKELLGIHSYQHLADAASREERTINDLIKNRLRAKLERRSSVRTTVTISMKKLKQWETAMAKAVKKSKDPVLAEIEGFINRLQHEQVIKI